MYFRVFWVDFTISAGAESSRAKRLTDQGLQLIQREESVKLWCWVRDLGTRRFVSPLKPTGDPLITSAIEQLPVSGPPPKDEMPRGSEQRSGVASDRGVVDGRICPKCGGKTKIMILNYWYDRDTDIVTPADTIEQCDCGWKSPMTEHERPF